MQPLADRYTCRTCAVEKPRDGFYCGGGRVNPDKVCKACRIARGRVMKRRRAEAVNPGRAAQWAAKRQANVEAQHPRVHPLVREWFSRAMV